MQILRPLILLLATVTYGRLSLAYPKPISHVVRATDASLIYELPVCARTCISKYVNLSTLLSDPLSICKPTKTDKNTVYDQLQSCITKSCSIRERLELYRDFVEYCDTPVHDHSVAVRRFAIIFGSIAVIAYLIQMLTLLPSLSLRKAGLDDVFSSIALVSMIAGTYMLLQTTYDGIGGEVWLLSWDDLNQIFWELTVFQWLYLITTGMARLSLIAYFRFRIFAQSFEYHRPANCLFAMCGVFILVAIVMSLLQCDQPRYLFYVMDGLTTGKCSRYFTFLWITSSLGIIQDLAIIGTNLYFAWPLCKRMSWAQKARVFGMFSVGSLVTLTCISRLLSMRTVQNRNKPSYTPRDTAIWSIIEADISVICVCLPLSARLIRHFAPQMRQLKESIRISASSLLPRRFTSSQQSLINSQEKGVKANQSTTSSALTDSVVFIEEEKV